MRLCHIHHPTTLSEVATAVGRDPRALAKANGIPLRARPGVEDVLFIPSSSFSHCVGGETLLLACSVEAGKYGSAPFYASHDISMILHHTGRLEHDGTLSIPPCSALLHATVPALLCPQWDGHHLSHEHVRDALCRSGYLGLVLPYRLCADTYHPLCDALHAQDQLFALTADGDALLSHPQMLCAPCDLMIVTPPIDVSLEVFLSDMTATASAEMRRKMLLSLRGGDGMCTCKKGARIGRLNRKNKTYRSMDDCYMGLCRLMHDGYGGVLTPCGETTPPLYHMIRECGHVIPASQRSGLHSRS